MYWTMNLSGLPALSNYVGVAVGNKIYSFGGYCSSLDFQPTQKLDLYILNTVTLAGYKFKIDYKGNHLNVPPDQIPCQRYGHTIVAHGTKIYLWGGRNLNEICRTLYCFDTETLKWSRPNVKGNIPIGRNGHTACKIQDCMYIYGGFQENPCIYPRGVYMLNLNTLMWSKIITQGSHPCTRDFHIAAAIGDRMYIFGGRSSPLTNTVLSQKEKYCPKIHYLDTTTGVWMTPVVHNEYSNGRRNHTAFVHKGLIYIYGGCNNDPKSRLPDLIRFDPDSCTWTTIETVGRPPCYRRSNVCVVINDKVYIAGGTSPKNSKASDPLPRLNSIAASQFFNRIHMDLHILDLRASLKSICLINAWKYLRKEKIHLDDLCIPISLKQDMIKNFAKFNQKKLEYIPITIYDDDFSFNVGAISYADDDYYY